MKTALLLPTVLLLTATGCETNQGDVAPSHKVSVKIEATHVNGDYAASALVQKEQPQDRSTLTNKSGLRGYYLFDCNSEPVRTGTTFITEVSLYPITANPSALAANTTLKAAIQVDGVTKSSVLLSSATPANSTGVRVAKLSVTL